MDKEQVEWAKEATDIEGNVQQKDMAGNQSAPRLTDWKFVMVIIGLGMASVGSQVQPFVFAAITPLVSASFNASSLLIWFFTTQIVSCAVISPFAGLLADMFGCKRITLAGIASSIIAVIVCASTPTAGGYIAGQVLTGVGIVVQELMAIAAITEIIPIKYRGYYTAMVVSILEAVGVYNSDEIELGIRTLPFGFYILGGAIISALMVSAFKGHLRWIMSFFYIIQAIAISCMVAVDTHNINTVWAPLVLSLIAVGGVLIPNQLIMTVICPDDLIATGTCLTVCLRSIGQVIGTSIFYTQFVSVLTHNTYEYVVPVAIETGITDFDVLETMMPTLLETPWKEWALSVSALNTAEKLNMLHDAVINAFAPAFARVWYISIAFGVAAVIASGFIEDLTNLMDEHIAVNYF
ncbi:hypothetical protein G4B11_004823 [Aspergillus flavus]|nr:hypothetical protein G4B11_004823 [Aspergillus flavus]